MKYAGEHFSIDQMHSCGIGIFTARTDANEVRMFRVGRGGRGSRIYHWGEQRLQSLRKTDS